MERKAQKYGMPPLIECVYKTSFGDKPLKTHGWTEEQHQAILNFEKSFKFMLQKLEETQKEAGSKEAVLKIQQTV